MNSPQSTSQRPGTFRFPDDLAGDRHALADLTKVLRRRAHDRRQIPAGWVTVANELLTELVMVAKDRPQRRFGRLITSRAQDDRFILAAVVDDAVVKGILRRAHARARARCRVCGDPVHAIVGFKGPSGYCNEHGAVHSLLALAKRDPMAMKVKNWPTADEIRNGGRGIPGALIEVWLKQDGSPAAAAARQARSRPDASWTPDGFDAVAFHDWLRRLVPALEAARRAQECLERAETPLHRDPADAELHTPLRSD